MSAIVERSPEQRFEALRRANQVRRLRCLMKRDLDLPAAMRAIRKPVWWQETMKVEHLLRALPGWGATRTNRVLRVAAIAGVKTLAGLTVRQRAALIAELKANPRGKTS